MMTVEGTIFSNKCWESFSIDGKVDPFAVQIRCAEGIGWWIRTLPGNISSLLNGMNQRVRNIRKGLMTKSMKISRERTTKMEMRN